jgi:streptomycin 6-kinase
MLDLWRPAPENHVFPTIVEWGRAFAELRQRHDGTSGSLPMALFERGEALYWELAASQAEPVVLHGDLHHWNVVSAERQPWLAIDPHGVVGEPAFEVGAWMRNPVGEPDEARFLLRQPDPRAIISRRLDIFAEELRIDRDRLRDWSVAFAVISACWSDESNHANGVAWSMAAAAVIAET